MTKAKERRKGKIKPKYTGELAQPIPLGTPPISDSLRSEYSSKLTRAWMAKLPALFDHYGIKRDSETALIDLVLSLAAQHVPGFQLAGERGRPGKMFTHDTQLYVAVRLHHLEKGLSVSACCNLLAAKLSKRGPGAVSGQTLRRQYTAAAKEEGRLYAGHKGKSELEQLRDRMAAYRKWGNARYSFEQK